MMIYLASPYTHPDKWVRHERQTSASRVAAMLMEQGHVVFSPITHGHQVAEYLSPESAHNHKFWMKQCLPILERCDMLAILPLPGWEESRGIQEEITKARWEAIPITTIRLNGAIYLDQGLPNE